MRRLAAVNLVTHLAPCVINQNLTLPALDKHHEVSDQRHHDDNDQGHQNAHGAGTYQLHQATECARQTRSDTGKDQDGNTVAQTTLGDLLAEPHQEHSAGCQADNGRHAKTKAGCQHQTGGTFQCDGNAHRLEQRQTQRAVARELGDLAAAGFAFFLELLECGNHIGEQLHDDGGRYVGHDAQRKHREA